MCNMSTAQCSSDCIDKQLTKYFVDDIMFFTRYDVIGVSLSEPLLVRSMPAVSIYTYVECCISTADEAWYWLKHNFHIG